MMDHALLCQKYRKGITSTELANEAGVTRARIQQILKKYGINRKNGGAHIKGLKNEENRRRQMDLRYLAKYGCTRRQWISLRRLNKNLQWCPIGRYKDQKNNAKKRGIEWNITLLDWWNIWERSGKWKMRGRGKGYVMARFRDIGPYAPGNVQIISAVENVHQYYALYGEEHRAIVKAAFERIRAA